MIRKKNDTIFTSRGAKSEKMQLFEKSHTVYLCILIFFFNGVKVHLRVKEILKNVDINLCFEVIVQPLIIALILICTFFQVWSMFCAITRVSFFFLPKIYIFFFNMFNDF